MIMDQVLYAMAAEIIWKYADQCATIILRQGTFHIICIVMSTLGTRFKNAGLSDLCIEAGIIAGDSVNRVMDGTIYNQAGRMHKNIFEAFMRRYAWIRNLHMGKVLSRPLSPSEGH